MRTVIAIIALGFVIGVAAQRASAVEPPRCPVMTDEYAERDTFAEYEGRKVYLCCERCRINFSKQPEKYVMHLASVGQAVEVDWDAVDAANAAPGMSVPAEDSYAPTEGDGGVVGLFGRSHVVWVHFPIACLVIAGVIRLGVLLGFEGVNRIVGTSGLLLLIGTAGAVVSAASGLVSPQGASFEGMQGSLHETFDRHKLLGLVLAGLSIAAVMVEAWSVGKRTEGGKPGGGRNAAHGAVVICAALAIVVAHLGGTLVHGPGFLRP